MGYPAATGRVTLRSDATHRIGGLFVSARRSRRSGRKGRRGGAAGSETRGDVRWPPREKTDRPRQRCFHWYDKSPTNHARVAAAPIHGPETDSCWPL